MITHELTEELLRTIIQEITSVLVIADESLDNAGIDSLDRIGLEGDLETYFSIENPEAHTWIDPTDTVKTLLHKIKNWNPMNYDELKKLEHTIAAAQAKLGVLRAEVKRNQQTIDGPSINDEVDRIEKEIDDLQTKYIARKKEVSNG